MTNRTISTASKSTRTTHHRPYFDDIGPRNVTAVVGQSALLNCRVKHPGDRTVSKLLRIASVFHFLYYHTKYLVLS